MIQGTNVALDTPEEIARWLAERRRRWPTDARVAEKKRKLDDAIARGQMHPDDPALRGHKRRRLDGGANRQQQQQALRQQAPRGAWKLSSRRMVQGRRASGQRDLLWGVASAELSRRRVPPAR